MLTIICLKSLSLDNKLHVVHRQILALAQETGSGPGSSSSLLSIMQSRMRVHMKLMVWSMKRPWKAHCNTVLLYHKLFYTKISASQLSLNLSLYKKK